MLVVSQRIPNSENITSLGISKERERAAAVCSLSNTDRAGDQRGAVHGL